MLQWPFRPDSTALVQGWGFWMGVAGLVLGLAGFAITIFQLRANRRATDKVRTELDRVRNAMWAYDANQETAKAQLALKAARKSLNRADWAELASDYEDYLAAMHIIKELDISDIIQFRDDISKSIEYGKRLCERIDSLADKGSFSVNIGKTSSVIRDHEQLLSSINVALQGRAFK